MTMEGKFQTEFRKQLEELFPGCIVLKGMANRRQGIPDLFMFWEDRWAAFELKRSENAERQPNQEYYIDQLDAMSFAAFVYPENVSEVLDDLMEEFDV